MCSKARYRPQNLPFRCLDPIKAFSTALRVPLSLLKLRDKPLGWPLEKGDVSVYACSSSAVHVC